MKYTVFFLELFVLLAVNLYAVPSHKELLSPKPLDIPLLVFNTNQLINNYLSLLNDTSVPPGLRREIETKVSREQEALYELKSSSDHPQKDLNDKTQLVNNLYQDLFQLQTLLWKTSNTHNIIPNQRPESISENISLDFSGIQDEYLSACINLTNLTPKNYQARVKLSGLFNKDTGSNIRMVPYDNIVFRKAVFRKLRNGKIYGDALVSLGDSGLWEIPAEETGQLWITLKTHGVAAGSFQGTLQLNPLDKSLPIKEIPVSLEVYPILLPEKLPIAAYLWDYALNDAYVRDLRDHKVNTFLMDGWVCPPVCDKNGNVLSIDFSLHDRLLSTKHKYGNPIIYSYGVVPRFNDEIAKPRGWAYLSRPWKKAFKEWIRQWMAHLKEKGLDYQDFSIQIWDEAVKESVSQVTAVGPLLRETDPHIRWVMDGRQTIQEAKLMDPYVDIWIPHLDSLLSLKDKDKNELIEWYKSTHKPVWCYTCNVNLTAQDPFKSYRLEPWYAWKLGFSGVCFWTYNSWRGDSWDDFDIVDKDGYSDNGVVYQGTYGPVPSRRWEAFRDGLQDYQYLYLLNQEILKAEASGIPTSVSLAKDSRILLNTAVEDVIESQSETRLLQWRKTITGQILKLQGCK